MARRSLPVVWSFRTLETHCGAFLAEPDASVHAALVRNRQGPDGRPHLGRAFFCAVPGGWSFRQPRTLNRTDKDL
jgi:hypothetical protein